MALMIANEHPVARIMHRCELCARLIQPGERYNRQRLIGDDGPYVFKDCAHCEATVKILNEIEGDWYDSEFGYSTYDLAELEPSTIQAARLKIMWKRQWRRRDRDLYPVPEPLFRPAEAPNGGAR